MSLAHSFFILEIDCIINFKGLLSYLAERVHLGHLCLYCNKAFKDNRRCQQHMIDKQHCFMNPEDEREYEEFYDFSKAYEHLPLK
mmetsp:Transcript_35832/g.34867  ORF Transcript_35832/g.34867 Transcript_35832/m.34867 type:complete len:85 (-) Transcript_35832:699-953(-)